MRHATLACFALWITASTCAATQNAPDPKPRKLALLIGIRDYPADMKTEFRRIFGPPNDVKAVAANLREHFQFDAANIHTLIDREATLDHVIGEFSNWLIPTVRAGDIVFVFYAGHGSVVPDMQQQVRKSEPFGDDSSYVLWDSRRGGAVGQFDLTDDELQSLLAPLVDKNAHVFVVTDACHSGGGTRGAPRRTATPIRLAPKGTIGVGSDNLPACWPKDIPFLEDRDPRRPAPDSYVHFAACRKEEHAQEWLADTNDVETSNGAFTLLLLEALRLAAATPGYTYEDLHRAVMWRFPAIQEQLDEIQNPSPEGGLERVVFDGAYRTPPGRFSVTGLKDNLVQIDAGELAGIEVGTRLRVFDSQSAVLGIARIVASDPGSSTGMWESDVLRVIDGAVYADWESPPSSLQPITIYDPNGQIQAFLEPGNEPLDIVRYDREPRYFALGGASESDPMREVRPGDPLRVFAPDGVKIVDAVLPAIDAPDVADVRRRVMDGLRDEISYVALTKLLGRRGDLEVDVCVRSPKADELAKKWKRAMTPLGVAPVGLEPEYACTHDRALNETHLGAIDITNRGSEPIYIHVISLMPDHSRCVIYPRESAPEDVAPLEPGESEPVYFVIAVPSDWPDSLTYFDQYLVLASPKPLNMRPFLKRETTRGAAEEPIPDVLEEALRGEVTRGGNLSATMDRRVGYSGFRLAIRVNTKE